MHFYRLLLSLFLLLFIGELCTAQSWDWISAVSYKSYSYPDTNGHDAFKKNHPYITQNGDVYFFNKRNRPIVTSNNIATTTTDNVTKFNNKGNILCGMDLNVNVITAKDKNGSTYFITESKKDVTINGISYKLPASYNHNILILKIGENCSIEGIAHFASEKDFIVNDFEIDKYGDLYFLITTTEDLKIKDSTIKGIGITQTKLIKCNNEGNLQWYNSYIYYEIGLNIDANDNIWLRTYSNNTSTYSINCIYPNGKVKSTRKFHAKSLHEIDFHTDQKENFYLAFSFIGRIILPNGQEIKTDSTSGKSSTMILKLDKNYDFIFEQRFLNKEFEMPFVLDELATDLKGNIYLFGVSLRIGLKDTISFANLTIYPKYENALCFVKLDSNGIGLWIDYATVSSVHGWTDWGKIYVDKCDNIYFSKDLYTCVVNCKSKLKMQNLNIAIEGADLMFIVKLNPYKLEFEINETCEGITLKNTSDTTAYKSFEWTLPDGTKHFSRDAYIETNKYKDTVIVSLKGIKPNGCENIFTRKLKFELMPKPVAKFTIDSFKGCQWVGIKFHNQSYKVVKPNCVDCEGFRWDFGDGTTSNSDDSIVKHIYKKPGTYKISLVFYTMPCSDTFTLEKQITIIEAPKPGFSVDKTEGCAPLTVNITDQSIGEVETYFYTSGDGQISNQSAPTFIYTKPGKYFITQILKGPTECITKDSVQITIRAGYSQSAEPEILTATVTDSNYVKVSWKKNDVTAAYKLIRHTINSTKTFQLTSADTFYLDKDLDVNKPFYSYTLYGTDSCGSTKQATNKAQTILLENHSQTTEYNYLRWSPYQDWKNGVQEYKLQYKIDSGFADLNTLPGNINEYKDAALYPDATRQICYKIIATENGGNSQQSQSNTVCMHFLPTIIVPNAFSPNNDSINDIFTFSAIGIESYQLTIYNRWGERIYSGTKHSKGWDGKFKNAFAPEGVYLYKISAKAYNGKTIYQSGNLQLLR